MTSAPSDFSFTRSMKSRATLKLTYASSSAMRTSRSESATLLSEIFPSPRRSLKTFCNLLVRLSNIGAEATPERNHRQGTKKQTDGEKKSVRLLLYLFGVACAAQRCVVADLAAAREVVEAVVHQDHALLARRLH